MQMSIKARSSMNSTLSEKMLELIYQAINFWDANIII